jgi:hypothetical protein
MHANAAAEHAPSAPSTPSASEDELTGDSELEREMGARAAARSSVVAAPAGTDRALVVGDQQRAQGLTHSRARDRKRA